MSKGTWKLGIVQDAWRHALGEKPRSPVLSRGRLQDFVLPNPGERLWLCVINIGREISNWVFSLPKLFHNSFPALQIVLSCCCGRTLSSCLSKVTQGQQALGALMGVTYTWDYFSSFSRAARCRVDCHSVSSSGFVLRVDADGKPSG